MRLTSVKNGGSYDFATSIKSDDDPGNYGELCAADTK
jgi:hypothetical protein